MENILLCGLTISLFIRLFYSIEKDFVFDVFTFALILGMILYSYNYLKTTKINIGIMDNILLGLFIIISLIALLII